MHCILKILFDLQTLGEYRLHPDYTAAAKKLIKENTGYTDNDFEAFNNASTGDFGSVTLADSFYYYIKFRIYLVKLREGAPEPKLAGELRECIWVNVKRAQFYVLDQRIKELMVQSEKEISEKYLTSMYKIKSDRENLRYNCIHENVHSSILV